MTMLVYDLAADDARYRFSPFCWRTKMALKHKGLDFETIPWRFQETDVLAPSGQGRVPVLVDNDRWVHDSWQIALYLDATYPDKPSLLGDEAVKASARLCAATVESVVHPVMRAVILKDIWDLLGEDVRPYFRTSREAAIGMTLEDCCADRAGALKALTQALVPFERTLSEHAFLAGPSAGYADYCLFGALQWCNVVCSSEPLVADSAVANWFSRLLDMYGGYARNAAVARADRPAA